MTINVTLAGHWNKLFGSAAMTVKDYVRLLQ